MPQSVWRVGVTELRAWVDPLSSHHVLVGLRKATQNRSKPVDVRGERRHELLPSISVDPVIRVIWHDEDGFLPHKSPKYLDQDSCESDHYLGRIPPADPLTGNKSLKFRHVGVVDPVLGILGSLLLNELIDSIEPPHSRVPVHAESQDHEPKHSECHVVVPLVLISKVYHPSIPVFWLVLKW